jgi:hypothetical protein
MPANLNNITEAEYYKARNNCISVGHLDHEPKYLSRYSDGLWAGRLGFDSRQAQGMSPFHSVQNVYGAYLASYPIGNGSFFPRG